MVSEVGTTPNHIRINASLQPAHVNQNRQSVYPPCTLNSDNINFPVKLDDISKFEKLNTNISVNVLGLEEKKSLDLWIIHQKENHTMLICLTSTIVKMLTIAG